MSSYTTQLRYICESFYKNHLEPLSSVDAVIAVARPKIFDFDYPYYKESEKPEFETKIIRHFYTREIGLETYGLWKLKLQTKMVEIMPYINKLYESVESAYDMDLIIKGVQDYSTDRTLGRTHSDDGESHSDSKNTGEASSLVKTLDTPQNGVEDLLSGKYITTGTNSSTNTGGTNVTNGTTNTSGKEDVKEHVSGIKPITDYSKLLRDYRESLMNVDLIVFDHLEDLFMQLWSPPLL